MKNFKVSVDLATFFSANAMSRYKLGKYNIPFCTIFVEAKDPDEAAHLTLQNFLDSLLAQWDDVETQLLCRKLRKCMRITRIKAE
jgi:hypothetical protein